MNFEQQLLDITRRGIGIIIVADKDGFQVSASKMNKTVDYSGENLFLGINTAVESLEEIL